MPSLNVRRQVAETVTRDVVTPVEITTGLENGKFTVYLNGQRAVAITKDGYLRRYRGLTSQAGVRTLPDGRIAIQAASAATGENVVNLRA